MALPSDRAGGLRPEPAAQSQPEALIPSAFPLVVSAIPDGLTWAYKVSLRGGHEEHIWSLVGERGGIHVNAWLTPPLKGCFAEHRWLGGIEGHSPIPREYESETPSHEHCWLIEGPCWHDGSSLQFSEQLAPGFPAAGEQMTERQHADVLREMISRYHSWLPEAQAIEARRAETGTGSVEDESAVAKPCAQSPAGDPS